MSSIRFEDYSCISSLDQTGPLWVLAAFRPDGCKKPLMICMHSYGGNRTQMGNCLEKRAEKGFFAIAPDLRGRGDSAGERDDGGVEIADIYDAMQQALRLYPDEIDAGNINIAGWSGGGGNVYQALGRLVGFFRSAQIFYGIADYEFLAKSTPDWYRQIVAALKAHPGEAPIRYAIRNAVRLIENHRYCPIHLFWDETETLCPKEMNFRYLARAKELGIKNIHSFESREGDEGRWFHGNEVNGHLAEQIYENPILTGLFPQVSLPAAGSLLIPGFLITPYFQVIVNRGEDALWQVQYDCSSCTKMRFHLTALQEVAGSTACLKFSASPPRQVTVNGVPYTQIIRQHGDASGWCLRNLNAPSQIELEY